HQRRLALDVRMRRRDPGNTSPDELEAAMAPFNRPAAHTPWNLRDAFVVHALSCGGLRYNRMSFTPSARTKLRSHLRLHSDRADAALDWLELDLRWAFDEERGYAARYIHPQFL